MNVCTAMTSLKQLNMVRPQCLKTLELAFHTDLDKFNIGLKKTFKLHKVTLRECVLISKK
jgi:hypothetical protein